MNTSQDEQLSAFIDGEMPSNHQADLSTRLLKDRAFRKKMARYQQIGATLRRQSSESIDASGVVERIQVDLAQEPHLLAPRKSQRSGTLQQISRIAWGTGLAAAVAVVAIVFAPQLLNPNNPTLPQSGMAPVSQVSATLPRDMVASPTPQFVNSQTTETQQWKRLSAEQLQQFDAYVVEHNEYADIVRLGRPSAHVNFVAIKNAN